jgi:hypothetical protein
VGVHRSRYELERVLGRYGASDFAFVEADANASIQFALQGRYVQLALPLPDPNAAHFTHTASGRARTVTAQERAYEQALREHWRALLLAVRGKLQSVESGISTFEDEFAGFLVPHFHEQKTPRRKRPKAVNWLLGSSHSVAIALVAAFLVPASAVGAFSLPPSVVDHLAAPFRGALRDELAVPSEHARAVALGQSNWILDETGSHGNRTSLVAERDFAASASEGDDAQRGGAEDVQPAGFGGLRQGAQATGAGSGSSPSQGTAPVPSGGQASDGDKQGGQSSDPPGGSGAAAGPGGESPSGDGDAPSSGDGGDAAASPDDGTAADGQTSGADEESQPGAGDSGQPSDDSDTPQSGGESSGGGSGATPADPGTDTESQPADPGDGHDNGNHNGADNGNHNGADNGNHNGADNGQNGGGQGGS